MFLFFPKENHVIFSCYAISFAHPTSLAPSCDMNRSPASFTCLHSLARGKPEFFGESQPGGFSRFSAPMFRVNLMHF